MFKRNKRNESSISLLSEDLVYRYGVCCEDILFFARKYLIGEDRCAYVERIIRSKEEYSQAYFELLPYRQYEYFVDELCLKSHNEDISYPGYCSVCGINQNFIVDEQRTELVDGIGKAPNWREGLVCPDCACNSRTRALFYNLQKSISDDASVLVCENDDLIYRNVHTIYPKMQKMKKGYPNNEFDVIISNDMLFEDNNYKDYWAYFSNTLKTGGKLMMNLYFDANALEEKNGVWGWNVINILKKCGFKDAYGKVYFSNADGYLGYLPIFFEAIK